MNKNWLTNVSEEPKMINATLDTGGSLKQVFILLVVPSVSSY